MTSAAKAQRGLTLIELSMAIFIFALAAYAIVPSIESAVGATLRAEAGRLSGAIRAVYGTAALTGKTCRVVFEFGGTSEKGEETRPAYRAECADGKVTISAQGGPEDEPPADEVAAAAADSDNPEDALKVQEKRPSWAAFQSADVARYELAGDVKFASVKVQHQPEPITEGTAYLYLFPGGTAEVAAIQLTDGHGVYTLITAPLTGKVRVYAEAMDVEM